MGELLRAICDQTALDAQTAFYTGVVGPTSIPGTGRTFGARQAVIQCKTDVWFLMMAWSMSNAFTRAGQAFGNWRAKAELDQFTVQDGANSFQYSVTTVPKPLQGYTLNNSVWLPEYVLWPPASLIIIPQQLVTGSTAAEEAVDYVTLTGIEYRMPAGY